MRAAPRCAFHKHQMIRSICVQCRKPYRWTHLKCPRCMHRNGSHPIILFGKLLAVVLLVAAIWYIVLAAVRTDDTASGIVNPVKEPESERHDLYPTPRPTPPPDPRFPR